MSDEKMPSGSSAESRGLSRRELVTGGGLLVAAVATGCSKAPPPSPSAVAALTPEPTGSRNVVRVTSVPTAVEGIKGERYVLYDLRSTNGTAIDRPVRRLKNRNTIAALRP